MTNSNDVVTSTVTAKSSPLPSGGVVSAQDKIGASTQDQAGQCAAFGPIPLAEIINAVVQHVGSSALIITADRQIVACAGECFDVGQDSAPVTDILAWGRQLGDDSLDVDLAAVLRQDHTQDHTQDHDFVTQHGHWLRRTLSVLDVSNQLVLISYRDVSHDYLQRFVTESQQSIMSALARHEAPETVFNVLAKQLEACSAPGTHASVLWLSPDGTHLRHIASPTLPKLYAQAINGVEIGPRVGSCGTAAYTAQRVIVEDIETDPLWEDYRDLALAAGLRACWSQPILSSSSAVLGTLALYREAAFSPSSAELALLDAAAQMAAMAIRNLHSESQINFQGALLDSVREAVIAIDRKNVIRYWGSGATNLFGARIDISEGMDIAALIDIAQGLEQARKQGHWSGEADIDNGDGVQLIVEVSVSAVVHYHDDDRGFVIILRDVSDRHAAEKRIAAQSRQNRAVAYLGRLALGDIEQQVLLDFTMETLVDVLEVPLCMLFELERDMNSLVLRAGSGLQKGMVGQIQVASDQASQIGFTLMSSTPIVSADIDTDTRFDGPDLLREHGVKSSLGVIIQGLDHKPYGVLGVYTRQQRIFSESDISFLQLVANLLAESLQREHANASLRQSEKRFHDLADSMPQIVWSANAEGQIDYFNERWNQLVGTRETIRDIDAWLSILHPDDRDIWVECWSASLQNATPFELEIRLQVDQPNGYRQEGYGWYLVRALPVLTDDGVVNRWYGSGTDINEQKAIEHRLREQAHELEMINWINATLAAELDLEKLVQVVIDAGTQLSGARFGTYLHSADDIIDQNYALYAFSGVSREALQKMDMPRATASFKSTFDGEDVIRSDDIHSDARYGKSAPHFFGLPSGHPPVRSYLAVPVVSRSGAVIGGMFFVHPDVGVFDANVERLITGLAIQAAIAVDNIKLYHDLMDSKNQMRSQYEQLNAIYATAPVGLCYVDKLIRVVSINDHLRSMVGYVREDVRDVRLIEVLGDAGVAVDKLCNEALTNRMPILNREIRWSQSARKENCYWLCSCYPILTSGGILRGINTVVQDITERKRGELDLARLGSIVSNSYDAIIGKTLDGIITSWNDGAERMFGYTADEVIGQSIEIIIPEILLQEEQKIQAGLKQGHHITIEESKRVRKDGVILQVALTISPIKKGGDEIVGVSTIIRDITDGKLAEQKARENEERMRLILKATHIGTWDWKISTGEVSWSANMEELHGRLPGSFDGTLNSVTSDVYPDDKVALHKAITQALGSDGAYQVEYRIVTETGEIRWIEGKGQVLYSIDGEPERMAGVCMDITERKESEQALRVNETLLRTQTEELAREHRQKDEFLAMLAHELRNPLAPISNMVQLIKIQDGVQREKILPQAIDVIGRQVTQMARLVDDLLDVARITRGYIELKSDQQDLRTIITQAAETATPWFEAKHQVYSLVVSDAPVHVLADATRLIQVISNLLNNASKYTGEEGRITINLKSVGREAVISIVDSGIGISADVLPHIFELFTQADRSLDRRQGGLGLGLPLVKKLVEMHHGTVIARSTGIGRGSEFVIRLPLADTSAITPEDVSIDAGAIKKDSATRILVVDDNVHSADAMVMLLETLGHEAQAAYTGPDALCSADQFGPDLVFVDIGLPLMDGYEVAAKLRARFGSKISLIALTGYSQDQGKLRQKEMDFDAYLLKPLSLDNLIALLAEHSPQTSTDEAEAYRVQ